MIFRKKIFSTFVIAIILILNIPGVAEIIPPERRIDWTPGIPNTFPYKPGIKLYGAAGDGKKDDTAAFVITLKTGFPSEGGILHIPEGTYLIKETLLIDRGIILRGEGADKTHLIFDLNGQAKNCIEIVTYKRGKWVNIISGFSKGSKELVIQNASMFKPDGFAEIEQDNNPKIMYTRDEWNQPWAQDVVGQIFIVEGVEGNRIKLNKELYIDYKSELNPRIRTQGFVTYAGVENLHIKRLDAGDGHTIEIKNAAYCIVKQVESEYTYRTHVHFETAYRCEIRENYFHHSHDYGGGGHGYGVDCGFHTTDCLIENNIFSHLRHSMMAQAGASGNVFAYNYSTEPTLNPGKNHTLCDISLHGHYANYNLFESNVVEDIDISDYWGPIGPGNTFLRNRVINKGIEVNNHSHGQNIIGNEILNNNNISIKNGINDTYMHGNLINNKIEWDTSISNHTIPVSYYLKEKPGFFREKNWPVLGSDLRTPGKIPAWERYERSKPAPTK